MAIRIEGAGDSGTNLTTYVVSYDIPTGIITIADVASTSVTNSNTFVVGANTGKAYILPKPTTPVNPISGTSVGSSVTAIDIGTTATWDGYIWVYTTNYGCTTDDRPSMTTNNFDKYSQVFDTTLGKPIWWTGSKWVLADGTDA